LDPFTQLPLNEFVRRALETETTPGTKTPGNPTPLIGSIPEEKTPEETKDSSG